MKLFFFILVLAATNAVTAQPMDSKRQPTHQDTLRGSITPERKWWDVLRYDIVVRPEYTTKTISGSNRITYKVLAGGQSQIMQVDLQEPLVIDSVLFNGVVKVPFTREVNAWHVQLPVQKQNAHNNVTVFYSGSPHEAEDPPSLNGGWIWTKDSLGRPWMNTMCQGRGLSVWCPCKDYQGDEPDSGASVSMVVPDTLVGVSNGRLIWKKNNDDHTVTYKWAVVNPINSYCLVVNIGKYLSVHGTYKGLKGSLDMDFHVLDYQQDRAKEYLMPNAVKALKCYEHWFGPYPFYEDGFKMVAASYAGEEHQCAISYGSGYRYGNRRGKDLSGTGWGLKYDLLVVHEIAHEWFGNSITADDLADMWVHEAFSGYAEVLYLDDNFGISAGNEYINSRQKHVENDAPPIGRYGINEAGSGDYYGKGRIMLHMIRQIIGDDNKFRHLLLSMNKRFYHRITKSKEVEQFICTTTGRDFTKVFYQYLRTTKVPVLEYKIENGVLRYQYTNCVAGFNMPVKVTALKDLWLVPCTEWKEIKVKNLTPVDTMRVDPNFYVKAKRADG